MLQRRWWSVNQADCWNRKYVCAWDLFQLLYLICQRNSSELLIIRSIWYDDILNIIGQRPRSDSDGQGNLVNWIVTPEPLNGYKIKIYTNSYYTWETHWLCFQGQRSIPIMKERNISTFNSVTSTLTCCHNAVASSPINIWNGFNYINFDSCYAQHRERDMITSETRKMCNIHTSFAVVSGYRNWTRAARVTARRINAVRSVLTRIRRTRILVWNTPVSIKHELK